MVPGGAAPTSKEPEATTRLSSPAAFLGLRAERGSIMIGKRGFVLAALLAAGSLSACGSDGTDGGKAPAAGSRLWVVPDSGAPTLTTPQRADFTAGNLYANAHTTANPNGAIRGQLDSGGTIRLAVLEGDQEAPTPVSTNAVGAGALAVDEVSRAVSGFVLTSGLQNPTVAHVHLGARGTAGAPFITLQGGPEVWIVPDDATLTPDQLTAFLAGDLYFNVHTSASPNGAIRGQIDKSGSIRLASLNGAQEVPAVATSAYGAGLISVDGSGEVAGFILTSGLESPTVAHVHPGARGASNDPIVPLAGGPKLWVVPDDATPLDATQRTAFANGSLYVNAHTAANPSGAIRGQLDKTGDLRLGAMTGAQETPPVSTTAIGAAAVAVDSSTGAVSGFFATSGLEGPTVAHVHPGARNATGTPLVGLAP